jgi:membrane-associated phospholipid phosphatase
VTFDAPQGRSLGQSAAPGSGVVLVPPRATRWLLLLAVLAGTFVIALGIIVARARSLLWVDRVIDDHLYVRYYGHGLTLNSALNHSSRAMVVVGLVFVLACWAAGSRRSAVLFALAPTLAVAASEVIKHFVVRHVGGPLQGYPSGHETAAVALGAALILVLRPAGPLSGRLGRMWRFLFSLLAIAAPVALGAALIGLRWHLPTDVFGGAALGMAFVAAIAPVLDVLAARSHPAARSGPPGE